MNSPLQHNEFDLDSISLEVKSYIYQAISEFEPFTTPETMITVVAKDPSKWEPDDGGWDRLADPKKLKTMHLICISLTEDGARLEEEGMHEDIYQAIKIAKEKLIKVLSEMQDSAISNQDRVMQINDALASSTIH